MDDNRNTPNGTMVFGKHFFALYNSDEEDTWPWEIYKLQHLVEAKMDPDGRIPIDIVLSCMTKPQAAELIRHLDEYLEAT
jgi:hypothetical protein